MAFHAHEDRDLFIQVLNRGVSFFWRRPRARSRVLSYTPKELWQGVERLDATATKNYPEGLGGGKNSQQNTQGGANKSNKKVKGTKRVKQECGICLSIGSRGRANSHCTVNHRWSAHDHKIIGENDSNPP